MTPSYSNVKLTIVSCWYNEEFMAPFFLSHYSKEVDKIIIYLDTATNDGTAEILSKDPKVEIRPIDYGPQGWDEHSKQGAMISTYRSLTEGWCILVDADEFIFEPGKPLKKAIHKAERKGSSIIHTQLWNVFRHAEDKDLDPNDTPIINQRRHGDVDFFTQAYNKPCIAKAGLNVNWCCGMHVIESGNYSKYPYDFHGVHWAFADPYLFQERYRKRYARMCASNKALTYGSHYIGFTGPEKDQESAELMLNHMNDPLLF